jgi:hypothetical protein
MGGLVGWWMGSVVWLHFITSFNPSSDKGCINHFVDVWLQTGLEVMLQAASQKYLLMFMGRLVTGSAWVGNPLVYSTL